MGGKSRSSRATLVATKRTAPTPYIMCRPSVLNGHLWPNILWRSPVQEKPGHPWYTVETTRRNIDLHSEYIENKAWYTETHLHIVAIVEMNGHHMKDMVGKESNKGGDNWEPGQARTGNAEVEGKEGCKDGGQGGEVVSHLGDWGIHRVEHGAHHPSIDSCEAVSNPYLVGRSTLHFCFVFVEKSYPVHCSLVGNSFGEPDDHIDIGHQV